MRLPASLFFVLGGIALIGSPFVLVGAGQVPADGATGVWPVPVTWPMRAQGALPPVILGPRGLVCSPSPTIVLAVPWVTGSVDLICHRQNGNTSRVSTRERTIPWPEDWEVLAVGERVRLELLAGRHQATTWVERCVPASGGAGRWVETPEETIAWMMGGGTLYDAWLLASQDPRIPRTVHDELLVRLNVPPSGM